jgi:hypothetical protein
MLALAALAPIHYTANRYAFTTLVSWLLLASLALVELYKRLRHQGVLLAAGVLAMVLAGSLSEDILYFRFQNGNREDARAAFQYIERHSSPGDVVLAPNAALGRFYLDSDVRRLATFDFTSIPAGTRRVWIVEDMTVARTAPSQYTWLQTHARLAAVFDVHVHARNFVMRVHVYDVPPE